MNWLNDFRYGARVLARTPGVTLASVVTLAVAIGASTAVFSIVDAAMLRPFPYSEPERIAWVDHTLPAEGLEGIPVSYPNYLDWRRRNRAFSEIVAFRYTSFVVTAEGEPQRVLGIRASERLFPLLGVPLLQGRGFRAGEDGPGAPGVAVISYGLWQRMHGGRADILGSTLRLDGEAHTVIGIMPAGFQFPEIADIWVPLRVDQNSAPRHDRAFRVIARLRRGIGFREARAEMEAISSELLRDYPAANAGLGIRTIPMRQFYIDDERIALILAFGAVLFVLLIACANVAGLLLARATARQNEFALRAALGASRWRLARQVLAESLILALLAAVPGVFLAGWALQLILRMIPMKLPFWLAFQIDGRVLLFTLVICGLTAIGFGCAPVLSAWRLRLYAVLQERGLNVSGRRAGLARNALVVAEIALAVVLLTGASLFMRTLVRLQNVQTGIRTDNVLTVQLELPAEGYRDPRRQAEFYDVLMERFRGAPGIDTVGLVSALPLRRGFGMREFTIAGRPAPDMASVPLAAYRVAGPGYFEAMGIALRRGRYLDRTDNFRGLGAAVISESMAQRFFAGRDPVGERIKTGAPQEAAPWLTIVGVVGDVRQTWFGPDLKPAIYVPYAQAPVPAMSLVLRSRLDGAALHAAVRRAVRDIAPDVPAGEVISMERVVEESFWKNRLYAVMFAVFGAVALVLASVGAYALVSYVVALRRREIAIRIALGASPQDVLLLAVSQGMRLAMTGLALGVVAAFAVVRLMKSLLFEITPTDPTTFLWVPALLTAVVAVACLIPAWRARRVDPMVALRA